ncbi:MAG: phytanoyl-CoA dioxygenase family protein [Methylacidiphilales bacterium]|nr:phytanoyl-CoA dioxygenase family protein [Candidatus Methylacidiphilales bacterium]NJR14313.1 phytanoyl-CoA dioxygenase family protein [Calothrix sp. CSU_2_0]
MVNTFTLSLTEEQLALLPTEEDIAFYEEHGWFISKKVIPDQVIDEAIYGAERFYRGERDAELPYSVGYSDWQPGDGDALRNNQHVSYRNKQLRKLLLQPVVGAIAARLARSKQVRLFEDTLVYKAPIAKVREGSKESARGGIVGWHTDASYSSNCTSQNMLSAWIPFYHISKEKAPLVVIDGSHKWSDNEHMRTFNNQNLEELKKLFVQSGREIVEVPIIIEKGQVSFHHCLTIHGSYPNYSDSIRLAFALYLQDYNNHYQPFWNQGQQVNHFLDRVCQKLPNGEPDYTDPAVFPAIWSDESIV